MGSSALLQCRTALIAEISAGKVVQSIAENVQEGIMLTPNQVLLLPKFDTTFWTQLANHLAQRDAAACILGIKWRRSNRGRI